MTKKYEHVSKDVTYIVRPEHIKAIANLACFNERTCTQKSMRHFGDTSKRDIVLASDLVHNQPRLGAIFERFVNDGMPLNQLVVACRVPKKVRRAREHIMGMI